MGKIVKAVKPFIYKNNINFKVAIYNAWVDAGGQKVSGRPFEFLYKSLSFHLSMPTFFQNKKQARLRFCEAVSLPFDSFPDYLCYEVIPLFWDCWPSFFTKVAEWMKRHNVRTAFFTSFQVAEKMKELCPNVHIYHLPEGIETNLYKAGKSLPERKYDFLEFGRCCYYVDTKSLPDTIKVLSSGDKHVALTTRAMLIDALADSKITICLPRSVNQPEIARGIETFTQRYWECMLSRVIIIGKAPKELIDILGYNPVIDLDREHFVEQVQEVLAHLDNYQELVDKNREMALRYGDWKNRVELMRQKLLELGYDL